MSIEEIPICGVSEIDQVIEGALFERWKAGNPTALRIQPEHVNQRVQKAVETIIANNGTYATGDNAVIHTRPYALPLATEMGHVLEEMGCNPCIILYLSGKPEAIQKLVSSLPSKDALQKLTTLYNELLEFASKKGHWVVPYVTSKGVPTKEQSEAISLVHIAAVNKGLKDLDTKKEAGLIKSHDILAYPVPHEGERAGFSDYSEWQNLLYSSMAIPIEKFNGLATSSEFYEPLMKAWDGKKIRLVRQGEYPVDLTMRLSLGYDKRPIIKDVGTVGNLSIVGEEFFQRVTNIPAGELCMAPIENSVDGYVNADVLNISGQGVIIEDAYMKFRRGRVVRVNASEGLDELKVLTGLVQPKNSAERRCYAVQNTIAELGIGINPYKINSPTGSTLIDEKMVRGVHIAVGNNSLLAGISPGSIAGLSPEHSDFLIGQVTMYVV